MPVTRTNEYHVYICMCDIIQLRPKTSLASVITYIYFRVHLLMNRNTELRNHKTCKEMCKIKIYRPNCTPFNVCLVHKPFFL